MLPNTDDLSLLTILYNNIVRNYAYSRKKLYKNSVLLTIMNSSSTDNTKILSISAENLKNYTTAQIHTLLNNNYIKIIENIDKETDVILTIKGIWSIESETIIGIDDILTNIQSLKLNFADSIEQLNEKEKVIIFSMIALRVFSPDCCMDLSTDLNSDRWQDIILKQIDYIKGINISKKNNPILEKKGYDHPMRSLMRHANNLPNKTMGIFSPLGNYQYYLDIKIEDEIKAKAQIGFLLSEVFPSLNSIEIKDSVSKHLQDIAHNESILVNPKVTFISFLWDRIIKDAIDDIYLGIKL